MSEAWAVEMQRADGSWFVAPWGAEQPSGLAVFSSRATAWEAQRILRMRSAFKTRVRRQILRGVGR